MMKIVPCFEYWYAVMSYQEASMELVTDILVIAGVVLGLVPALAATKCLLHEKSTINNIQLFCLALATAMIVSGMVL